MRNFVSLLTLLLIVFVFSTIESCQSDKPDIVIVNAKVVDGSGNRSYQAHVYVKDGIISQIDTALHNPSEGTKTIDAAGRVLAPGFIDVHSHGNPLTHGAFANFLAMGVTTITLGQDGFSPATDSLAGWIDSVDQKGIGPNIAMFIGHGTLRNLAGVGNTEQITAEQLKEMSGILEKNLPFTFGMSTGLEYAPALYAAENELLSLAAVVGKNDKMTMSHMRNEDDDAIINSIEELIDQGKYCQVHIAHLKSVYGKGAARAEEILKVLYDARKAGVEITADVYPYMASYTGIAILFPDWAKTNEQLQKVIKTRRPELKEFIVNKVNARNGPDATLFGTDPYKGKTLKQVADEMELPFEKVLIDSIGPEGASAAYFVMNKELQERFITDPLLAISSDGSPVSYHPRGHGTFAKLIETYVVKDSKLTLEEAVRKVTSYPASILGLNKRGVIKTGYRADLILFDPQQVRAVADYSAPHQLAEGFDYVIVNGKLAIEKGVLNKALFGKVLIPGID